MTFRARLLPLLTLLPISAQVPEITSVIPASARPGEILSIRGQDFDRFPASNSVYIGNIRARVTQSSVTELHVEVPPGVQPGLITVTAGQLTGASPTPFLPLFAPYGLSTNPCYAYRAALQASNSFMPQIASADLDRDGAAELITTTSDGRIRIYQTAPGTHFVTTNSFTNVATLAPNTTPSTTLRHLSPIDYDNDGRLDLVTAPTSGFLIYKNVHTTGRLTGNSFAAPIRDPRLLNWSALQIADVDRDGRTDLVTLEGGLVSIYKNIYDPRLASNPRIFALVHRLPHPQIEARYLSVADLNRDGHMEIVTAGSGLVIYSHHDRAGILTNNSFAMFRLPPTSIASLSLADIEGDGFLDIVVNAAAEIAVLWNQTAGMHIATNLFPRVRLPMRLGAGSLFTNTFDFNGDARPDLFSGTTLYHPNLTVSAPGVITSESFASAGVAFSPKTPTPQTIADINGDGAPDLIPIPRGNVLYVLENVCAAPPHLQTVLLHGSVQIRSYGLPNDSINLESTSDFRLWTRTQTILSDQAGETSLRLTPTGAKFYRLRRTTPRL